MFFQSPLGPSFLTCHSKGDLGSIVISSISIEEVRALAPTLRKNEDRIVAMLDEQVEFYFLIKYHVAK
jgi:hypothetical protein